MKNHERPVRISAGLGLLGENYAELYPGNSETAFIASAGMGDSLGHWDAIDQARLSSWKLGSTICG
jgi:hypothetical protein